jgi:hypothetical protein
MFELVPDSPSVKFKKSLLGAASSLLRTLFGIQQHQLIVVGFPRSGTSLIYNMLSANLDGFTFEEFEKYFIHRIHRFGNIATKAPMDVFHLHHRDRLNINRKKVSILIMVRDVRDVITSKHPIFSDDYFIGYDHSWWPQNEAFNEWAYDAPGVMDIYREIIKYENDEGVLIVRYEDLIDDPAAVQKTISDKFQIKFSGAFADYHDRKDRLAYSYEGKYAAKDVSLVNEGKAVTKQRVGRWGEKEKDVDRVRQQFTACPELFDVLEHFGYEKSRDWFAKLA